ncbi:MAG: DUF3667 domain-containing protein [Bacteroidota bacterium]
MPTCNNCGHTGTGKYCSECGHSYQVKRITVASILHEVAHIFTHFEKGFGYTFKQLATRPGKMQREYIHGFRSKHQKPFSMFFICASLSGLAIYWISKPTHDINISAFDEMREHFYRHYYVILQTILIPYYALINWLLFWRKELNYAEALVWFVYTLSFILLLVILPNMINLIPHRFETYYIEIPLLSIYIIWTNLNFFNKDATWLVILKSIIGLLICWFTSNMITNEVIRWMMH